MPASRSESDACPEISIEASGFSRASLTSQRPTFSKSSVVVSRGAEPDGGLVGVGAQAAELAAGVGAVDGSGVGWLAGRR